VPGTVKRKPGVLEWRDIPAGLVVHAQCDWPVGLVPTGSEIADIDVGSQGVGAVAAGIPLVYRFEHAAPPDVTLPGGAVVPRTAKRFIIPSAAAPFGPVTHVQQVPAYAVFVPAVGATLYQKGRIEHSFQMPGHTSGDVQEWLRCRWVGTAVAGATLVTVAAETEFFDITWVNLHTNLVPGSIVITLPTSGGTLRDDGKGRLVGGTAGDGLVDYQSGAWWIKTGVAETGAVLVNYEHSCPYYPLDVHLSWDGLMQ